MVWLLALACSGESSSAVGMPSSAPDHSELPFETVVQGAASGGSGARPSLLIVQTDQQRASLEELMSPADRAAVEAVDLTQSVILGAFQGLKPTSGYAINVRSVQIANGVLKVIVRLSAPAPGEPVRQGFETPYKVIRIDRQTFTALHPQQYELKDVSGARLDAGRI